MALEASTTLWSDDYEQEVIGYLKKGKTGQTLPRTAYHILKNFVGWG